MRYAMPKPELIGSTYYLRLRVPNDVAKAGKGSPITVPPVGGAMVTVRQSEVVKVSLRTKEAALAKQRFATVHASLLASWDAMRRGPISLSHKQCVALAGEVRNDWVNAFDDNPGEPEMWQQIQALDEVASTTQPPPSFAELLIGPPPPSHSNTDRLEGGRIGGFADVVLRRHSLVVDHASRMKLLSMIAQAM